MRGSRDPFDTLDHGDGQRQVATTFPRNSDQATFSPCELIIMNLFFKYNFGFWSDVERRNLIWVSAPEGPAGHHRFLFGVVETVNGRVRRLLRGRCRRHDAVV